jgi:hypothetical protein
LYTLDDNPSASNTFRKVYSNFNLIEHSRHQAKKGHVESDKQSRRYLGGTLMYQSPESKKFQNDYLQNNTLNCMLGKHTWEKVDIYAAGLVLFEMCGQFKTQMDRVICTDNLKLKREFPKAFLDKFF